MSSYYQTFSAPFRGGNPSRTYYPGTRGGVYQRYRTQNYIAAQKAKAWRAKKANYTGKKGTKQAVQKQITALKKATMADQAYHTYRASRSYQLLTAINEANYTSPCENSTSTYEQAVTNLRYYDPSVPTTLVTANAASGTYSRVIHFKSVTTKMLIKNNFQVPCNVRLYIITPKDDTSQSPINCFDAGGADQIVGTYSRNTLNQFPTDFDIFNRLWKVEKVLKRELKAGQEMSFSKTVNDVDYDPSIVDTHSLTYQRKYKTFAFLIRIEGCIGHDSAVAGQVGLAQAGVDIKTDTTFKITYDAGCNLNDFSYANDYDTFTNGAVQSQPTVDNQAYSVA